MNRMYRLAAAVLAMLLSLSVCIPAAAETRNKYGPGMPEHFDGEELEMLSNRSESQMMSFLLTGKNGAVVVVDGGTEYDADHLRERIAAKGGYVSAWFITHAHSDHAGAFVRLVNEGIAGGPGSPIVVANVFGNFPDSGWYHQNEGYRADFADQVQAAFYAQGERAHVVHSGDRFTFDSIDVEVLNDPILTDTNSINNSSVVYRMTMNGKRIVFLGDLGTAVQNIFLERHAGEDLKCDFLQMAHHGQGGVDRSFYERFMPTACLWTAPYWLYENDNGGGRGSGPYATLTTRQWMDELGVQENYCIKDGDIRIR